MAMNILKLEIYFSLILYSRDDAGMGVFKWLIKVKGIEKHSLFLESFNNS